MLSFPKTTLRFVLYIAVGIALPAQTALTQSIQLATPAQATPPAPTDQLGRNTPANSMFGFLKAATSGDYSIAAQYLQMSPAHRQTDGEQTAMKLKFVLDNDFVGNYSRFNLPEGTPQEGVPLGHQRLGTMSAGDVDVDLDMVRVTDPSAGRIWLISSDTLAKLSELYDQAEARQVASKLPSFLVRYQPGGMPLWQWLSLLVATPFAAGLGWLVLALLEIPLRWWARKRGHMDVANWRSVSGPAWLLTGTLIHQIFVVKLRLPLLLRHYYFQITSTVLILSATWIFWRVIRWSLYRVRLRALARGLAGTGSLMLLGERIFKAIVLIGGIFAVLGNLGFNMSTALAGLGIGGLAIGFGAQKTIENLFGGVSVLGDEVFRVGDVCRFGDRSGTVEDIGLRSTWIRTEERTLLAIPNGTVATIYLENLSRRDKILFKTSLSLRSETKAEHLRFILSEVRRLLYSHPKVESNTVRVRLTDIAGAAPSVEIFSYILTQDFNEFAAVREDLLLRIMDVVDNSGSGLALPAQTLYLGRDSGLAKDKAETAVQKVAELREEKKLPFPDFHKEEISSFKGSIDYPPKESTLLASEDGAGKNR